MTERPKPLLTANIVLLFFGLFDLGSTLWWLRTEQAVEANPLMAAVLKSGVALFVAVKISTLAAYVAVVEWYRRHRNFLRAHAIGLFTVLAYAAIYTVSFILVNHRSLLG